jgi:hypothetical protein
MWSVVGEGLKFRVGVEIVIPPVRDLQIRFPLANQPSFVI